MMYPRILLATFLAVVIPTISATTPDTQPQRIVFEEKGIPVYPIPQSNPNNNHVIYNVPSEAIGHRCTLHLGTSLYEGSVQVYTLNLDNTEKPYQDQHIATYYAAEGDKYGCNPRVKGYPIERLIWPCKVGQVGFLMSKDGAWWDKAMGMDLIYFKGAASFDTRSACTGPLENGAESQKPDGGQGNGNGDSGSPTSDESGKSGEAGKGTSGGNGGNGANKVGDGDDSTVPGSDQQSGGGSEGQGDGTDSGGKNHEGHKGKWTNSTAEEDEEIDADSEEAQDGSGNMVGARAALLMSIGLIIRLGVVLSKMARKSRKPKDRRKSQVTTGDASNISVTKKSEDEVAIKLARSVWNRSTPQARFREYVASADISSTTSPSASKPYFPRTADLKDESLKICSGRLGFVLNRPAVNEVWRIGLEELGANMTVVEVDQLPRDQYAELSKKVYKTKAFQDSLLYLSEAAQEYLQEYEEMCQEIPESKWEIPDDIFDD
ncbi:hypothetical protein BJ508DRAFT_301515 [Ascobolus immersus RN42]|uniref:Uncharacterized protein n=1 Tax=Ascobolus immersus RN42 TaxID=1160509 RepID=A0A3N4IPN7_ASCIM|nr:hypothetical protein BJ508DRAFT_301515 [Ascobolus immersus RN42]